MQNFIKSSRLLLPTVLVGIGLSGFFDGILLHQVLQWHHLLSLVSSEPFRDIGMQILADGLFHLLMYFITASGLWLLWRRRAALASPAGDWRAVFGGGMLGFGGWNLVDVGLFHWILGIHRVRVNVPDPLVYDLAWFFGLGLGPFCLGALLQRGNSPASGRYGAAAAIALVVTSTATAFLAARPVPGTKTALVVFAPGTRQADLFNAARAAGGAVIWIDPRIAMMAVSTERPSTQWRLYQRGALLVIRSPALAGCAAAFVS